MLIFFYLKVNITRIYYKIRFIKKIYALLNNLQIGFLNQTFFCPHFEAIFSP
jgi:hypothetical protein